MSALRVAPEVAAALAAGRAVVALESTLIAHGLPKDRRLEVARSLHEAVRAEGAVPATCAVVDGALCAGVTDEELARVAEDAMKASLRDLAVALARGGVWATTVASTMDIAARAGIATFATGGIGGVHRQASQTYDESADLVALATRPVAVISAGAKAVLDLPRTVERLETLGVPILGYRTYELPAFYHGRSGIDLVHCCDSPAEIAAIMRARFDQLSQGGLLVVQPPLRPQDPDAVEALIREALDEADRQGICGNAVTPFLLRTLAEASAGDVVQTNVALVTENARLAARIAVAHAAAG